MFRIACLFLLWIEYMMICVSSLAWPSVLLALLQACAISVVLSWVNFPFLVTFFWSIPMTSLWCHWPYSFFLDFVMVRCWKYWDEALRWLVFKMKCRKGSWASSFSSHPAAGSKTLDAARCCAWLPRGCEHVELQTWAFSGRRWHHWIQQKLV